MRLFKLIICLFLFVMCSTIEAQDKKLNKQINYLSTVWQADNGDGTYRNPIIYADYSDPDVIRVGDDYYMTASSFNCSPGLPILRSNDLVNWQLVNYALSYNIPDEVFNKPMHGKGVWAPCIRYHNNEFYIYWGDPDYGVYMIKTSNPLGRWSDPILVLQGKGVIDSSPLWDNDGKVYLVTGWAASRAGFNSVLTVWQMNADGTHVIDKGKHVYDGHGSNHTIEGPKFYKKDDFYYILAPAGGVTTGWQVALRSKSIYGPYEVKTVMAQGKTTINGPHQGGYVETQTGESWFIHFQDKGAYGRIIHLNPVKWLNGWPVIGVDNDGDGCGEPVMNYTKPNVGKAWLVCSPLENDEFNTDTLGMQWQWSANEKINWSCLLKSNGFLRLFAYPKTEVGLRLWDLPNVLLQKFPAPDFKATAKIKFNIERNVWFGKKAGLVVMGNDYAFLSVCKDDKGSHVQQVICKDANLGGVEQVVASDDIPTNEVYLRVEVQSPDALCKFSYSVDGQYFILIGQTLKARPELWIGSKVGLFCLAEPDSPTGGYADVDWFRITK